MGYKERSLNTGSTKARKFLWQMENKRRSCKTLTVKRLHHLTGPEGPLNLEEWKDTTTLNEPLSNSWGKYDRKKDDHKDTGYW